METKGYFSIEISIISWLALSVSFEYLYHVSTAIRNMVILLVQGLSLDVRVWQLQTSDFVELNKSTAFGLMWSSVADGGLKLN